MAKNKHGNCALCLQPRELRKSHLLGRAIYVLMRDGGSDPVLMTPQLIEPTQRQLWCHLLCGDCEERFNKHGENAVMRLVQRKTDFALLNRLDVAVPIWTGQNLAAYSGSAVGIDTEQLAYFALSVLWRSGVQQWRTLNQQSTGVSLGNFEEPIRKYLAGETGFPAGIAVNVRVCTDYGSRMTMFAPSGTKGGTVTPSGTYPTFGLLVRGLWFHIVTSTSGLPPDLVEICCFNSPKKVIFKRDCEQEMLQAGGHIMATAAVSPRLPAS